MLLVVLHDIGPRLGMGIGLDDQPIRGDHRPVLLVAVVWRYHLIALINIILRGVQEDGGGSFLSVVPWGGRRKPTIPPIAVPTIIDVALSTP